MNKELAKTLTTALVQFIDRDIPEGTMCCSNTECDALEHAFMSEDFFYVESLVQKKLSRLTEFEQEVSDIVEYCKEHGENVAFDYAKRHAKTLLSIAKKELLSYHDESNPAIEAIADLERTFSCNPDKLPIWLKEELNKAFKKGQEASHEDYIKGYANGYKDAEKRYNESVAYHYPEPVLPGVVYKAPNNWNEVTAVPNLDSGTSTAKAEG